MVASALDLHDMVGEGLLLTATVRDSTDSPATPRRSNRRVHPWAGGVHDVRLQWPSLVAGFIDSLVDDSYGAERRAGAAAPVGGSA